MYAPALSLPFKDYVLNLLHQRFPPLYQALQRIWQWDDHIERVAIADGLSWWELLVKEVNEREAEMLCLA